MSKVSFILPAYKRRFLREAIASILAQTYRDFELIVVDDCSPEDLKSVVDEFHDERMLYHRNEMNLGGNDLVAAWNKAMESARGEWCVLASDDDIWLPCCLEKLMMLVDRYPECDLFHARSASIDASGAWMGVAPGRLEFESQVQFIHQRCVLRAQQQAPDFMFRRSAWERIGGFVKFPLAWHSDDATWLLLARNGCAHTSDVTFCFRNSGINLSTNCDSLLKDKIDAGVMFDAWLHSLIETLCAKNKEEECLLKNMTVLASRQIYSLVAWEMASTRSVLMWVNMLLRRDLNGCAKRIAVYMRFPIILAIRKLFPVRSLKA